MFFIPTDDFNFDMAKTEIDQAIVDEVKHLSEVPTPWCQEFEKMISGMMWVPSYSRAVGPALTLFLRL